MARNYPLPLLTFCLHIYFQYNFVISCIISTLFPHLNLFVSIFIQSYANSNFHVSTLYIYILIIDKARNSETLKIVHLLASVSFNAPYSHYIIQTRTCIDSLKKFLIAYLLVLCIRLLSFPEF